MTLGELVFLALRQELPAEVASIPVMGVAQDNRKVKPGFVFVARQGDMRDGHAFVPQAIAAGAVAIVGQREGAAFEVPYIQVPSDKQAVAALASAFFNHPSQKLRSIGVTGTDGKTTTSFMLHHILSGHYKTGLLSTAGIRSGDTPVELEGHFTTPEATEVQEILAMFLQDDCTHAVIESSSHAFAMHRLDGVHYDTGVWTNLSPEHLDYHKTFEAYREAKENLMQRAAFSILNHDDPEYLHFMNSSQTSVSYALEAKHATYCASDITQQPGLLTFKLTFQDRSYPVSLPMMGRFNVYNALAAIAAAHHEGLTLATILSRLESFPGVPGRMQLVMAQPFAVLIDFAHTAMALGNVLSVLRPVTTGRLITVIGAAGERDPGKRRPLADVAVRAGDIAIFTEEDARSEDIHDILRDMQQGALAAGASENKQFYLQPDRTKAIAKAIALAKPADTIILAGKGHERTLERKTQTLEWDEHAVAVSLLRDAGYDV